MSSAAMKENPPTARDLVAQTRPFAEERPADSWWVLLSTFALIGLATVLAAHRGLPLALRLVIAAIDGLLIVRGFIVYHDYQHGALLRDSLVARALTSALGYYVMAPPR